MAYFTLLMKTVGWKIGYSPIAASIVKLLLISSSLLGIRVSIVKILCVVLRESLLSVVLIVTTWPSWEMLTLSPATNEPLNKSAGILDNVFQSLDEEYTYEYIVWWETFYKWIDDEIEIEVIEDTEEVIELTEELTEDISISLEDDLSITLNFD